LERIARGSGTFSQEVHALLKTHKQFEQVVKKMGETGMMKGSEANMTSENAQEICRRRRRRRSSCA